ncbi:Cytochrome c biogenesis protein CycY [uncultured Eubacterium sp.]|uniref:TlpA family protein disulfide reductase n=1 Tax=Brotomerdimonas butyrica TaxID=2981721 RepID=UPI0008206CFF|nr:TlpA disulfide reductase family protein [Brotomerdimonas butyrica]MCU6756835.1 TlpA family protein disulfide reductase [Brotomerdimonas butyrica]SCI03827.1 Cytochrome c biogenesis protein CycY [uncultured Eubacterium sp.]
MKKTLPTILLLSLILILTSCSTCSKDKACCGGSASSGNAGSDMQSFPAFTGSDLDGGSVSSDIFAENSVTVVNFWFSSCAPCVGELPELNALNEELMEKGGAVIGINTDTLGGSSDSISEAKKILEKQGALYRNLYFDDASKDAIDFANSITAFPTTYLVDRSGNIIGEPLRGSIDNEASMKMLKEQIDKIIKDDMKARDQDS